MKRQFKKDVTNLFSGQKTLDDTKISEKKLEGFPKVLQDYLRFTGIIGKPAYRAVRCKQKGTFRLKEGGKWYPLEAEHYASTENIGFAWLGKIKMAPLVNVTGKDMFIKGRGCFRVKLAGIKTIVDKQGPEADEAELIRFLGEIVWYPFALFEDYLRFEEVGEKAVKVTLTLKELSVSGTFHFDDEGRVQKFTTKRYMSTDKGNVLKDWVAPVEAYKEFNGINVPTKFKATWKLETGDYDYIDGEVTDIEYGVPELYR